MAYHSFGGEVEARTPPRYAASTPHAVTNFRAYLGIDRLALLGPLVGAVIPRHHRPVAGRFGISSRRERGPVGRTLAAAVRLSGCVFVEHVKGHAFRIHERLALRRVGNLGRLRAPATGSADVTEFSSVTLPELLELGSK